MTLDQNLSIKRMIKRFFQIVIFSVSALAGVKAQTYPQYTQQPLGISPDISGGFCVMRAHHFHLGLDFRTQRKEGFNIYSVEDGYVKRIKISHYGYGRLIQIQHPDGYVSHYGHLSGYAEPIAQYVKDLQYKMKSYEVEIFPPAGLIKVTKGQVIAYSGNSGGSTGPHLHFEIRDSTNTYVLNPLLFGIKIADTKKPVLQGIRLYSGGKDPVNYSVKKNKYGAYYMSSSTLYATDWWKLAYNAIDPQDGSGFKNSVHQTQLFVDDKMVFEFILDKLKIDDQRSSDYHMDYKYWVETGDYYEKLFLEEGNLLPIYTTGLENLMYTLTTGTHTIKIRLADFYKNTTEFSFNLNFTQAKSGTGSTYPTVAFDKRYTGSSAGNEVKITIEPNTLYYHLYEKLEPTITSTQNEIGEINFSFGTKYIPVRYSYKMDIKVNHSKIPVEKLCLVYYNKEGKMKYYSPVSYNENSISVDVKDMGSFSVWADTTRPEIKKITVRDSMYVMYNGKITTTTTDNLSDISKYNAYFDGVWHLTEYEYKEDKLTTKIPDGLTVGPHTFEIEVFDDRMNRSYRKMTIFITKDENDLVKNKKR
jgi:hypothetical protein